MNAKLSWIWNTLKQITTNVYHQNPNIKQYFNECLVKIPNLLQGLVLEVKELLKYIQIRFLAAKSPAFERKLPPVLPEQKALYVTIKITFIVTYPFLLDV